jgi:hypothetical protein
MTSPTRTFTQLTRSWYRNSSMMVMDNDVREEMMLTVGDSEEFAIRWYKLSGELVPRLEAFCSSFEALHQCQDFMKGFAALSRDNHSPTPEETASLLESLVFTDATAVQDAYGHVADDFDSSGHLAVVPLPQGKTI